MNKVKKIFGYAAYFVIAIGLFVAISAIFALFDCGTAWDLLKENKATAPAYALPTLIAYRIIIYTIPSIIFFLFKLIVMKIQLKKALVDAFNIQFASYAIAGALWKLAGMDYYWNTNLFDVMDSFILLAGLALSFGAKITVFSKTFEEKTNDSKQ